MVVSGLRLVNFRSYCDATVRFGPGLNVVVGENATGKTNLLEAAWFVLRGSSPRTRRDEKLITWNERFARVELTLESEEDAGSHQVDVGFAPGQGKRMRWGGLEITSLDDLRGRSQVFIFVPESLLLVKGSPARRRAHLDAFAAPLDPQYAGAARALQGVLRQRNAQLAAVKNGADPAALDPWDQQFARAATEFGRRRRDLVDELTAGFAETAAALAPAGERFTLRLIAQLESVDYDEASLLDELRERRPGEVSRGLSLFGPHRDDLKLLEVGQTTGRSPASRELGAAAQAAPSASAIPTVSGGPACGPVDLPRGGRDLRLFGSQGEQRAAVLALLLAEQRLAAARTGQQGPLFLDDVMSELDDPRRRLLVRMLTTAGQVIITTTNRHYFTDDELARATVIELPLDGSLAAGQAVPPPDDAPPAQPALDAL
ncbi:MAG TPA: DNA replication and repair protein RecF [Thermoleophilia bacterium]|nr:DNA replication and repair protein RecF [Thermoleophilia bacterium]